MRLNTMKRYFIGVDLDGTLLTSEKQVTDRTFETIQNAVKKGSVIVPVTGRPLSGIPQSILNCKEIEYIITSNGAVTYDLREGRIVENKCLPFAVCNQIYHRLYGMASVFEVFTGGEAYEDERSLQNLLNRYHRTSYTEYIKRSRKVVNSVKEVIESAEIDEIAVMFDQSDAVSHLMQEMKDMGTFQIVETAQNEFEIYDNAAGKGNALIRLANRLHFSEREIVAIGDSNNDLDMMDKAEISIAMGNALDNVKKAADIVTSDNDHDGVAEAIRRLL